MKMKWLVLVCLLVAMLAVAGCAPAKSPAKTGVPAGHESIRLVGGTLGGTHATSVMTFAAILNRHYPEIEWSSSSGSVGTSPVYVTSGTMKLAMASPPNYIDAYGFDRIPESRLRSINHPTVPLQNIFLIPEDKPWKDITQVPKGLTLSPGAPGSGTAICAEAWLKLAGLSKSDFNWVAMDKGSMTDAWRAGKLDAFAAGIGGLAPYLIDMNSSARKIKPLGLTPEQVAKAKAEQTFERLGFSGIAKTNIAELAPEVFKYDVVAPMQPSFLFARDDFPEDIAYRMAKIIDERNAELAQLYPGMKYATPQLHLQWAKPPFDVHPGVAKYYKEKGYLK